MAGSVEIIELREERRYVYADHRGSYTEVVKAFDRFWAVERADEVAQEPRLLVSVRLDDPQVVPEHSLRSRVGVFVLEDAPIPPGLKEGIIPAGRYAKFTHMGPYSQLSESWRFLYEVWLSHSGAKVRADVPGFEIYLNSPADGPSEVQFTDIFIAIQ